MSQLRKALGAGVIVTEGRGYRLAVAPEQVDFARFDSLASEGRRALAQGDAERARELLCAALELWRGEPLADFAYADRSRRARITRLQETRLAALQDRIEADLALGGDGQLVGELESLIAANPLQERLRRQLMVALYRAGRQADALAVYRQVSELLRDELGLEPSPMLQELERSIFEHDVSLDVVGRAGGNGAARLRCARSRGLRPSTVPTRSTSAVARGSFRTCSRGWPSPRFSESSGHPGSGNPRCCGRACYPR